MTMNVVSATALWVFLLMGSALAHKIGSETTGTAPPNAPSVESCTIFSWTKKRRCSTYDTTHHHWEVVNNCPRSVKVRWADNSYDRPIKRNENTDKPRAQKGADLREEKTLRRSVECVDKAELEICIEYIYPPLKEHGNVNCDEFFD